MSTINFGIGAIIRPILCSLFMDIFNINGFFIFLILSHLFIAIFGVGQLPDHPNHPKGRNPYAHVAICVKSKFNASYKDIPDEKYNDVIKYIEFLKQNPN